MSTGVARAWRDARVTKIWAGSNEIMKELTGRDLGLAPAHLPGGGLRGPLGVGDDGDGVWVSMVMVYRPVQVDYDISNREGRGLTGRFCRRLSSG